MGVNYDFNLAIGFQIEARVLLAPFTKHFEEVSHMEECFDPKTGKKLNPKKVVDEEAYDMIVVDGEETEYYDALETIATKLECAHWSQDGDNDEIEYFILGPEFEDMEDGFDGGRVSAGGSLTYEQVMAMKPQLQELRGKLFKLLGKDPGEPVVKIVWSVG